MQLRYNSVFPKEINADVNHPPHTQGPVDGSLYATVTKNPKNSTNGSCELDMTDDRHASSISSGISSAASPVPNHSHHNELGSCIVDNDMSPSPTSVHDIHRSKTNGTGNGTNFTVDQTELDELLNGLLKQIASFPDPITKINKYEDSYSSSCPVNDSYSSPTHSTHSKLEQSSPITPKYAEPDGYSTVSGDTLPSRVVAKYQPRSSSADDRPYHTRAGSRPFSYGVTAGSPALQRRRIYSESTAYVCESTPTKVPEDDVFSDTTGDELNNLTWLQRQQQKLRAKRESKGLEDRQWKEQMLFAELRGTVSRRAADTVDSTIPSTHPNHVNTNGNSTPPVALSGGKPPLAGLTRQLSAPTSPITPTRVSSKNVTLTRYPTQVWQSNPRTLQRQLSDSSTCSRRRPFVAVKNAHQLNREQMLAYGTTPEQALVSSPVYGNIYAYQQNNPYSRHLDYGSKEDSPLRSHLADDDSISATYSLIHHSTPKNAYAEGPSSWSSSLVSNSPPVSPCQSIDRPQTPQFPSTPRTPYVNHDSTLPIRKAYSPEATFQQIKDSLAECNSNSENGGQDSPSVYYGQSRRSSMLSLTEAEVISQHSLFVKDTSSYWYKPTISREEAINFLREKPPGTFIVRDSNSFPGAFGLALKVASLPPNVQNKSGDISTELVRHFLIEPTSKGVQLKGCPNEPVFGSLSALVYQHSVTPMDLPCKLIIPDGDACQDVVDGIMNSLSREASNAASELLAQGAACNVFYLLTVDTESLTGPPAVRKSISELLQMKPPQVPTIVHLKVQFSKGITLTDNSRRLFFRRHYPISSVSYCGLDPEDRRWTQQQGLLPSGSSCLFGFVARKPASKTDNQCHIFAEYESEQPATAIVSFINKVLAAPVSQRNTMQLK